MSKSVVLIVDDDVELSAMLVSLLQAEGWATQAVHSIRGEPGERPAPLGR